jgi:hypothetical protein
MPRVHTHTPHPHAAKQRWMCIFLPPSPASRDASPQKKTRLTPPLDHLHTTEQYLGDCGCEHVVYKNDEKTAGSHSSPAGCHRLVAWTVLAGCHKLVFSSTRVGGTPGCQDW